MAFRSTRGRNVSAELVLHPRQLSRYWRADPDRMERGWRQCVNGAVQTGAVGLQGNVANALAALFIACGQDVACVTEAATALTRIEQTRSGELYASVTLPNLIVGTVGGGCVEADVWAAAKEVMQKESPRKMVFNLNNEASYDNGLICGGTVEIFIEPILPQPIVQLVIFFVRFFPAVQL